MSLLNALDNWNTVSASDDYYADDLVEEHKTETTDQQSSEGQLYSDEAEPIEPLLDPKEERLRILPIKYQDVYDAYVKHKAMHWTWAEIPYSKDYQDFMYYPEPVQRLLKYALAFFASSDFLVNKLVRAHKFESTWPEVLMYLANKENREVEHSLTYAALIKNLIDPSDQEELFNAIETMPIIARKAEYMMRYMNDNYASRLVSDAINEGIFFSGLFCIIFFCKKRFGGKTPGLYIANDFIVRDETDHRDFACLLYRNHIVNKLSDSDVRARLQSACELEHDFIREAFDTDLIGLSCDSLCQYMCFVTDGVYRDLGYEGTIYGAENPFEFMAQQGLHEKTDSFTQIVTNYQDVASMLQNDPERAHENEMGLDMI